MADVINLDDRRRTDEPADSPYDIALDDEPTPGGQFVDVPPEVDETRRPIVPAHLRTARGVRHAMRRQVDLFLYRAGFHAARSPRYALLTAFWAVVGIGRTGWRMLRWWWHPELSSLLQTAANEGDTSLGPRIESQLARRRVSRGIFLLVGAVFLVAAVRLAPWWQVVGLLVAASPLLAHFGHPVDRRIVSPAVVTARHRRINSDILLRAYYAAGLGNPDKEDQQVKFGSQMGRDASDTGSQVVVELPYGRTFEDAIKAKERLASGLDVSVNQVFLTIDPTSHRSHTIFVADRDPLAVPAGLSPLLDGKQRSIWRPAPLGRDERDRAVSLAMMWLSILIGAQPRKGKTFTARQLALFAAMDPWVKILIADGKNSPDWRAFVKIAHRMVFGTHPGRDGDPVEKLLFMLREIKAHIQQVNDILSTLPADICPEGKLTEALARDRRYPELRVWMLIMEEFQVYYELDDADICKEIAGLLSFIIAVGPSAGVIVLSSSQKPSGVGSGNTQRLFTRYRDNHTARFALKCGSRTVSEAILGTEAYGEGYDASALPSGDLYRGVGYLYGVTDHVPTVRTYFVTQPDAERIIRRARQLRDQAGLLSGEAAGEVVTRERRDVLADVAAMFQAGEPGLHWDEVAARLADRMPEHYADIDAETISAQMRAVGVASVDVKRAGAARKGCRADAVRSAMDNRRPA
jgi:hypothetical protein